MSARRASHLLGTACVHAASFADFRRHLSAAARWVMEGIDEPGRLWQAEGGWWTRLEADAAGLLRGSGYEVAPVVGAVAMLSVDAWRVRAALELAARGGQSLEPSDALV